MLGALIIAYWRLHCLAQVLNTSPLCHCSACDLLPGALRHSGKSSSRCAGPRHLHLRANQLLSSALEFPTRPAFRKVPACEAQVCLS